MKQAENPSLTDLKKLLKRLEKIDPEARKGPQTDTIEPAAGNARKLQKAILDRPANDEIPADGLLQLKSRDGRPLKMSDPDAKSELPVVVKPSLPATSAQGGDAGAVRTAVIASVTAAVVSALATAGTVYWLNARDSSFNIAAPFEAAETAPMPSASKTAPVATPARDTSEAAAEPPAADPNDASDQPGEPTHGALEGSAGIAPEANDSVGGAEVDEPADSMAPEDPQEITASPDAAAVAPPTTDSDASVTLEGEIEPAEPVIAERDVVAVDPGEPVASQPLENAQAAQSPEGEAMLGAVAESSGEVTPPTPHLVGVTAEDVTGSADAAATAVLAEPSVDLDADHTPAAERSSTAIESPGDLVAALIPSEAVAAPFDPSTEVGTDVGGTGASLALSSDETTETLSARTQEDAPTVTVYEAPEVAGREPQEEPSSGVEANIEAAGAAPVHRPAVEQTTPSTSDAALSHPSEASIPSGEFVDLPISINEAKGPFEDHYLIVSGLKRGSRLTGGVELMFDTWRVDVSDLDDLQLSVPAGFARRLHVSVELRRPDGTTRERTELALSMPGLASKVAADSEEASALAADVLRSVDEGEVQVDNGNLLAARILFQRAAAAGSARAAMLLAGSYDPAYISAFKTSTPPEPDVALARSWYLMAAQLGAESARERLALLSAD